MAYTAADNVGVCLARAGWMATVIDAICSDTRTGSPMAHMFNGKQ